MYCGLTKIWWLLGDGSGNFVAYIPVPMGALDDDEEEEDEEEYYYDDDDEEYYEDEEVIT